MSKNKFSPERTFDGFDGIRGKLIGQSNKI